MNIPMEFIKELVKALEPYFVRKAECAEIQTKNSDKFANDDKKIELLTQRLDGFGWILKTIAVGAIGTLVTSLLNLILK